MRYSRKCPFKVGDRIVLDRPKAKEWLRDISMDEYEALMETGCRIEEIWPMPISDEPPDSPIGNVSYMLAFNSEDTVLSLPDHICKLHGQTRPSALLV